LAAGRKKRIRKKAARKALRHSWSLNKRLVWALGIFAVLFLALFIRLFDIMILRGPELQRRALDQWTRTTSITAARGRILDAKGKVLATNDNVYKVVLWPNQIDESDRERVATELSRLLDMDYDAVYSRVSTTRYQERILKRQIDEKTRDAVEALKLGAGVGTANDSKRSYPYNDLFAQIIGFTDIDNNGQEGLELAFNDYLSGTDGKQISETDSSGNVLAYSATEYIDPIDGLDLVLTGDSVLQSYLESALENAIEVNNAKSAQGIIMDCTNGAILAISSQPDYNPNEPPRSDLELLAELSRNRVVTDVYEPGSTFKIVTLASAIDSGAASKPKTYYCAGGYQVNGETIHCWRTAGHGSQNLTEAAENSCNCAFMQMALGMGKETFYDYIYAFGFGQSTDSGLAGESSGIVTHEKYITDNDLARIGFGQSIAVTPIQLCTAVCAAVNGGYLYQPHIIQRIVDNEGNVVFEANEEPVRQVVSEETSAQVREILQSVVDNGTGRNCRIEGYNVGGKTGTAQKYDEYGRIESGSYICSFIGFAPADDPKYVCLILVDEPHVAQIFGSTVAAPFVKTVLEDTLHYGGILPSHRSQTVQVPNLWGRTVEEAKAALEALGLAAFAESSEGTVTAQVPAAGETAVVGSSILLYTGQEDVNVEDPDADKVYVVVPDLKGMTPLQAHDALAALGLIMDYDGDDPYGYAFLQDVSPGTTVVSGIKIKVYFTPSLEDAE